MKKTYKYFKNPIVVFIVLGILIGAFLLFKLHFQIPNIYTDITAAKQAALISDRTETYNVLEKLMYKNFPLYNFAFHLFFTTIILAIMCIVLRINNWANFFKSKITKNRIFAYIWINTTYPLYAICWTIAYMETEASYIRHMYEDTLAIPLFATIYTMSFFALIYYPAMNFITFIIYNQKTFRKRYIFLISLALLYFIPTLLGAFTLKFSYWLIPVYIYLYVTITMLISGIHSVAARR